MSRLRLPLVILAFCLLALPAEAGWRFAEWGMSKEQLLAASNGEATPHYEPNAESWGEYPVAKSLVNEMRHKFEVWYFVDPVDGLYAIKLIPQGFYWCIDVREQSMRRWGYTNLRYENQNPTWRVPSENNLVSIIGLKGCSVKLEPLDWQPR